MLGNRTLPPVGTSACPDCARFGCKQSSVDDGRDINLDINVDRARIEDFLCLTSKDCNAMLSGPVVVKAS